MLAQVRSLAIAGALGLVALTAQAQATSASLTPAPPLSSPVQVTGNYRNYLYQHYAADKEARAIVHLFARKFAGGEAWVGTGAVAISLIAFNTGTTTTESGTTTFTVTPLGYGLLVGLFGGVGIGKMARFGNEKLYQALLAHDQQRSLPEYVTRRLKDRDYKPVSAVPTPPAAATSPGAR